MTDKAYRLPEREDVDPQAGGWPDIAPPPEAEPDLPPFPTGLLPPVLRDMTEQAAAAIQAPVDIAGMLIMPICSSTLAGKVRVEGRPEHREHTMLWTVPIAPSSERKTPVFEVLRQPLTDLAKEFSEASAVEDEIRRTKLAMVERQIDELKNAATKAAAERGVADLTASAEAELGDLIAQRRRLEKLPPALTEWSTSPTPEGLQRVMAANWGRAAVFTDEGGLIGTLAGRYSGDKGADMDPFLSGFVGSPLRSPRAGSDRPFVDAAYLTVGMAVQPKVIEDLASVRGAEERGLLARFLFASPKSMVGTRMYGDARPISAEVSHRYGQAVKDWGVWQGDPENLVCIGLDPAAYTAYEKFHDGIELRQGPGGDLHQQFIVSKVAGITLRVAGMFHCFELGRQQALSQRIGERVMRNAIEMAEGYFIPHALHVASRMRGVGPQGVEVRILNWITRGGHREFKLRDLTRALAKKGTPVEGQSDLLEPVAGLVDEGYLRMTEVGNRTSVAFKVNPQLFELAR